MPKKPIMIMMIGGEYRLQNGLTSLPQKPLIQIENNSFEALQHPSLLRRYVHNLFTTNLRQIRLFFIAQNFSIFKIKIEDQVSG